MLTSIFAVFNAGKMDILALCFLSLSGFSLIMKIERSFWLQFSHMLRKDTGRLRNKNNHFAPGGTNSQGVPWTSRPQLQDPASCPASLAPSALMRSSLGNKDWQQVRISWDLACSLTVSFWRTVVQNIPISTPHSSWPEHSQGTEPRGNSLLRKHCRIRRNSWAEQEMRSLVDPSKKDRLQKILYLHWPLLSKSKIF